MKARRVEDLDPAAPLAANAERIVRVRLDELCSFMPRAGDPSQVRALHDMRIAAKRLRYVLEVTHPVFGPYAAKAVDEAKALQDVLGEIHDCDVQLPETADVLAGLMAEDARALATGDEPPNAAAYAGLVGVIVRLKARRDRCFAAFLERWRDLERAGFRARLEYAIAERAPAPHDGG